MSGWVKFPYIRWDLNSSNIECIPMLTVMVSVGDEEIPLDGVVDSGAQDCIVHQSMAETFGVDLSLSEKINMGGVGGKGIVGFLSKAKIRVAEYDDYEFETPIIFADIPAQLLLGQNDFFKNFQVLFERDKCQFSIKKVPKLEHDQ